MKKNFSFYGKQVIIRTRGRLPHSTSELVETELLKTVVGIYLEHLRKKDSKLLGVFPKKIKKGQQDDAVLELLKRLGEMPRDGVVRHCPELKDFFRDTYLLRLFIENLYNHWRGMERYLICYSNQYMRNSFDKRPYTTFNDTIERMNGLVRMVYREIIENVTNDHPRIYRQVPAACQVGVIVTEKEWPCPKSCKTMDGIPFVRQVLIEPPLIIDPLMNKRSGRFVKVSSNPLKGIKLNKKEWLCYPAKVGDLLIHIFFHPKFIGLGVSLANLFDLADDKDLQKNPDAIFAFGVPDAKLKKFGEPPTVFFDDEKNDLVIGAISDKDDFGYFGYLKKMALTLHNIVQMKRGRMPVHGAMVKINLKSGKTANVVIWGDTGTGKSESLEAFRMLSEKHIRDMTIIFDDMGSLGIARDGKIRAYGTETGAFVRLDDLQPGFAFGNIDRSIIHSPQKINARAVLPITSLKEITVGHTVDYLLYANNYEEVDSKHPIFETFETPGDAIKVFKKSARMAKGTTGDEKGIVYSYFANPFGPTQHKDIYDKISKRFFKKMFFSGVKVGQIRTRLGIPGFETKGPKSAALALFKLLSNKS